MATATEFLSNNWIFIVVILVIILVAGFLIWRGKRKNRMFQYPNQQYMNPNPNYPMNNPGYREVKPVSRQSPQVLKIVQALKKDVRENHKRTTMLMKDLDRFLDYLQNN